MRGRPRPPEARRRTAGIRRPAPDALRSRSGSRHGTDRRGPHAADAGTDFEVRTFIPGDVAAEDPVTGSFNAGAAQWLIGSGRAPISYTAAQGTVLGRAGRVHVEALGEDVWVGGSSTTCITGTVEL